MTILYYQMGMLHEDILDHLKIKHGIDCLPVYVDPGKTVSDMICGEPVSLRDQFAMAALAINAMPTISKGPFISVEYEPGQWERMKARRAYAVADAMLAEREAQRGSS